MTTTIINPSIQKRIFGTLFATQAIYRATIIATFTLTPIIATNLSGSEAMVGYPNTLGLIGRALFAYPVGLLMDRVGRRLGLSTGYLIGLISGGLAIWSIVEGSFFIFMASALLLGMMQGAAEQSRYVAAEVYPEAQRPRIIGLMIFCGTIGAIFGPLIVGPSTEWSEQLGLPANAGPFVVALLLQAIALILTLIFLRPDPLLIGQQFRIQTEVTTGDYLNNHPSLRDIFAGPMIKLGVVAMIIGQLVMVLLMVVTPLHMHHHAHTTQAVSWVIMAHTLGMFGLSSLTGFFIERLGRVAIILIGTGILLISCILTPLSTVVPILALALFLLGLGWNFCFVAGSTLLADYVTTQDRGRAQGAGETMVALASGGGSFIVGSIFAAGGITVLSLICAILCGVLLLYAVYSVRQARAGEVVAPELN